MGLCRSETVISIFGYRVPPHLGDGGMSNPTHRNRRKFPYNDSSGLNQFPKNDVHGDNGQRKSQF
ncbi:MAG TPA: hypothetical protein DEF45_12025 [Rhodopirellula sp.]|nr:MAG: hypothetical protein CBD74_10565 [Saprospirales bacterium TMED214]HBV63740.1 hypothetical protein [Rhodopirellula sp.]